MRASSTAATFAAALLVLPLLPTATASAQEVSTEMPDKGGNKKKNKKKKKKKGGQNAATGPFKKKDYPIKELKRPLVLPNQMGEVGAAANVTAFAGDVFVSAGPDFHYGIADVLEVGVGTSLAITPDFNWSRSLPIDAHYLAVDTKSVDFAPGLVLPLNFNDGAGFGVLLDATTRAVVSDKVFFTFGQGAIPLTFSPDFAMSISANGGVGYQLDKAVVLGLDTNVLNIALAPDAAATGPWDFITLTPYGQYSWSNMGDVGVRLNIVNFWDVPDSFVFSTTVYGAFRF